MTYHILWIEDSPQGAFAPYLAPILSDPDINLELAYDATEAFQYLQTNSYHLIIFDLDLPAGENDSFQAVYRFCVHSPEKHECVLGCHLLRIWLGHDSIKLPNKININALRLSKPLTLKQIVVYSIYANNFRNNLKKMGIKEERIIQKNTRQARFFLHRRIKSFLEKK